MSSASPSSRAVKLGRNQGGYRGETLDIDAEMEKVLAAAGKHGWQCERFFSQSGVELPALRRCAEGATRRIYLSAGIHGDEPAGPLALRRLLEENEWPGHVDFWICPCLNPAGFRRNTREDEAGLDLNRQYHHGEVPAVAAHIDWLSRQPDFDLAVCLHEDWEALGFYLYELNLDHQPSRAEAIIQAVKPVCPIDLSPKIEGRAANGGIVRPSTDPRSRPDWPEAFYLITHKTRHSYTLEAPSDFALTHRVEALCRAVHGVSSDY